MHSSPSSAPDASRFGLNELNANPRTGPECFCIFVISAPEVPSEGSAPIGEPIIFAGLYKFTLPSTNPPAMIPCGVSFVSLPAGPHTSLWKRSFAATAPPARGMSVDGFA
eukprot:30497-Pelagococcus_subviridis.AAC.25